MSDPPRCVMIVCAKAPLRIRCVPAVRQDEAGKLWLCSWCGERVKVAWW